MVLGAAWSGYSSAEGILIERKGSRLPLNTKEGTDAFYANLEDYVRLLQGEGAKVYLVLGVPVDQHRLNPSEMIARRLTGFRVAPEVEQGVPSAELRAMLAADNAKLHAVGEHTGTMLLDPFPDICGNGESCSPFFGAGEPKFSDGAHLRPMFVQQNVHFLDPLLK